MTVVTRYAPSPTGNPHVGNIRTALFAYLFARNNNGQFLLRIEDTDQGRFVPESLKYIEDSLSWLGIDYDGEKVFQSDRLDTYREHADQLIANGHAYKCFCSTERLEKLRKDQEDKKQAPGYDGHCAALSAEEVSAKEKAGEPFVVRFRMPKKGEAKWNDLVRGQVRIKYDVLDDSIILKSDGWPTYHLGNIVDDHEMGVTHVIRGEEWIPSTPKHIAMYQAFGWDIPTYAHLPVILGSDKSKLSKRHGDTAILDYKDRGYLPEAMVNFLALLGWNDGTEDEQYTKNELIKKFDLARVQKSPAVFDIEKLNWLNGQYLRKTDTKTLKNYIAELYPTAEILKFPNFDRVLEIEKTRLTTLADIKEGNEYFFKAPANVSKLLVFKKSNKQDTKKGLEVTVQSLEEIDAVRWDKMSVKDFEDILGKVTEKASLTNGDVFWPVRVALSGLEKSPSPAELIWALGKKESIARINKSL